MKRLCTGLRNGRPCPRRVMKPLGLCDRCGERERKPQRQSVEAKREWAARQRRAKATAGLGSGMESAG